MLKDFLEDLYKVIGKVGSNRSVSRSSERNRKETES